MFLNESEMILRCPKNFDFLVENVMFWTQKWFATCGCLMKLGIHGTELMFRDVSKMCLSGFSISCLCLEILMDKGGFGTYLS